MFQSARIKLTAWYLLIIMCVSIAFSIVIHRVLSNEIDRFSRLQRLKIERRFQQGTLIPFNVAQPVPLIDPELIQETKNRLDLAIIIVNILIFIVSGGIGYFLAGKTLRPIQEMVDEQNRFITDASHELRTPLTSLKTSMEVWLRDKKLSLSGARALIQESIEEVDGLQALSENLLHLAQYEKPSGGIRSERLSIEALVDSAILKINPLAKRKKIRIEKKGEDAWTQGNRFALVDLLVILLDNAIKYSSPHKHIFVEYRRKDGSVNLSVKDQGNGIDPKDIPHLFERFYRADKSRSKDTSGFGLGLSIAKKIVETHKGSIKVESILEKGSTFIVTLPLYHKRLTPLSTFS